MGLELRDYQQRIIDKTIEYFQDNPEKKPCVVAPTGAGKSVIVAFLAKRIGGKTLLLTHQKELLEQDADAIRKTGLSVSFYSASIGEKDFTGDVTCAGIASLHRLKNLPSFDLVMIDEAHLINNGQKGMYRITLDRIKQINPATKILGLTATPFRLGQGMLTDDGFFDDIIDVVSIKELQDKGYLAHLTCKWTETHFDFSHLRIKGGEFLNEDIQEAVSVFKTNEDVVNEIIKRGQERKAWLIFCAGVKHAVLICDLMNKKGISCACVTGKTPKDERQRIIEDYKNGKYRCITNAKILTTGFNYPDIDLIALLQPTLSPGLYLQELGRGMRVKSEKDRTCLVLDFAENVYRHGTVDCVTPPTKKVKGNGVAPCKVCPECGEIVHASKRVCPICNHVFPQKKKEGGFLDNNQKIEGVKNEIYTSRISSWWWDLYTSKKTKQMCIRCRYIRQNKGYLNAADYFMIWGNHSYFATKELAKVCNAVNYRGNENALIMCHELNLKKAPDIIKLKREGKYLKVVERIWLSSGVRA